MSTTENVVTRISMKGPMQQYIRRSIKKTMNMASMVENAQPLPEIKEVDDSTLDTTVD